jgi:predicted HicB family RNase H-like nuclease
MMSLGKKQRLERPVAKRVSNMMVRMTEEQYRAVSRCAALHGLSTSAWVRMTLLKQIRAEEKEGVQ